MSKENKTPVTSVQSLVVCLAILLPWFSGINIAKGFVEVTVAIFFPPYAWYLSWIELTEFVSRIVTGGLC